MDIQNHTTKDVCHLKYDAYNYFGRDTPRKVGGRKELIILFV